MIPDWEDDSTRTPMIHEREIIWEDENIRFTRDVDEPWRAYIYVHVNGEWVYLSNPRLGSMAAMALALLGEYHENTQWG